MLVQSGIGLTVFAGTSLLLSGKIELVPMLLCLLIVTRIYGPIITELTLLPELFYHQIAIRRMRSLMNIQPMEGDTEKPVKEYDIQLKNISFRYNPQGEETIKNVNATIPAGAITALVGPSGSGKSTLSRLIARFWDVNKGQVEIGGIDVKELDPEHLMEYMSFVFQDVVLFNDTVYNNIKIGNMNATEEQVLAAAKAASCDEFIEKMPDGYQTVLGENGSTLSGGERQRLSIARALLKDAPIVLLDEATASLDPESESSIQQAIGRLIHRYVEGGSTITQQLAKNLYFSQEKTMNRKAAEVFLALELERNYTKDEILELYVNSIYFGDGYYNVGEASEGYFGKPAAKMNDYECTLLAGVPNAPSKYAPSKNLALAEKRQKKVISRMEACGYLTKEDTTLMSAELVAMN